MQAALLLVEMMKGLVSLLLLLLVEPVLMVAVAVVTVGEEKQAFCL